MILWVATAPGMMLVPLAQAAGYFAANGVAADVEYLPGSPTGAAALASGRVQFAEMPGAPVALADAKGLHEIFVMGFQNTLDGVLLVPPSIRTPAQLRGTTMAISKAGSFDDITLEAMLRKVGLRPGVDVKLLPLGSTAAMEAALSSGRVQGMVVDSSIGSALAAGGSVRMLMNAGSMNLPYESLGLVTTAAYARSHPAVVTGVVKAMAEAEHRFVTDPAFTEKVMESKLHQSPAVTAAAWKDQAARFARLPLPTQGAVQALLRTMKQGGQLKGAVTASDVFDPSFVDQLQQQGFFRRLWGGG